jgi:hypothetical protein
MLAAKDERGEERGEEDSEVVVIDANNGYTNASSTSSTSTNRGNCKVTTCQHTSQDEEVAVMSADTLAPLFASLVGFVRHRQLDVAHKTLKTVRRFLITTHRQKQRDDEGSTRDNNDQGTLMAAAVATTTAASTAPVVHSSCGVHSATAAAVAIAPGVLAACAAPPAAALGAAAKADLVLYSALVRSVQAEVAACTSMGWFLMDVDLKESDLGAA